MPSLWNHHYHHCHHHSYKFKKINTFLPCILSAFWLYVIWANNNIIIYCMKMMWTVEIQALKLMKIWLLQWLLQFKQLQINAKKKLQDFNWIWSHGFSISAAVFHQLKFVFAQFTSSSFYSKNYSSTLTICWKFSRAFRINPSSCWCWWIYFSCNMSHQQNHHSAIFILCFIHHGSRWTQQIVILTIFIDFDFYSLATPRDLTTPGTRPTLFWKGGRSKSWKPGCLQTKRRFETRFWRNDKIFQIFFKRFFFKKW